MPLPVGFGLDAYRKDLDDRGLAVAAAQEASIKSRRQLADITKSASPLHADWEPQRLTSTGQAMRVQALISQAHQLGECLERR